MSIDDDKASLLAALRSDGGLHKVTGRTAAAKMLSRECRIYIADIGGELFACLAPRAEKARLQESLARHKLTYRSQAPHPGRDNRFAAGEADLGRQFQAIGLSPSYPNGFL